MTRAIDGPCHGSRARGSVPVVEPRVTGVPRVAVKVLLLDPHDRLLLIRSRDSYTHTECWYPVGGGVEAGETLQDAAAREADEETGLRNLPIGRHVWRRDHTYHYDGRTVQVHEEWLLHRVAHFQPVPAQLTEHESRSIVSFCWWSLSELAKSAETVFPPQLGNLTLDLLTTGLPRTPIDITSPTTAS